MYTVFRQKVTPKTSSYNSTKTYQFLSVLAKITVNQVEKNGILALEKNRRQRQSFISITENMKFATPQLRSYALTLWEFLSRESDESFCECSLHFSLT